MGVVVLALGASGAMQGPADGLCEPRRSPHGRDQGVEHRRVDPLRRVEQGFGGGARCGGPERTVSTEAGR